MKFVIKIITILMLSLSSVAVANALTVEVLSEVTRYTSSGDHEYFGLDGIMSEVTDVRVIAHINVISLPTIINPETGEVVQCAIELFYNIDREVSSYPAVGEREVFDSVGEKYLSVTMSGPWGYDCMTLGYVLDATVRFTSIPPYVNGWYTYDVGEIYVDHIELVIDGVLPTEQTSFGGMKMLFR